MRQKIVKFGSVTPLNGVVTEPVGGADRNRPWVILLNSGILHHIGVNRLHVQIARRLASQGYSSLRFDFSGLGDSEARRDSLSFEQSAPRETSDAIDYLAKTYGAQQAVLVGLCSGADVGHLTALADQRVVGLGLLDAWAYRTPAYFLHYYGSRLIRPANYARWVRVRWNRIKDRLSRASKDDPGLHPEVYEMPEYLRVFPPREKVAGELRSFMERGVELNLIFSGGLEEYNHQGQYRSSFADVDFGNRLRETHVRGATHVFSAVHHQEFVVQEISTWVQARFGKSAPVASRAGAA